MSIMLMQLQHDVYCKVPAAFQMLGYRRYFKVIIYYKYFKGQASIF